MTKLAASDAQQFGIQIVGGTSTGKTSYLAAFWHQYLKRLKASRSISYSTFPPEAFDELEQWYQQGLSSSTTDLNANMYSVVHKHKKDIPYQLTIYDIAGEAFSDLSNSIQQQQFRYCEGLIFVIDPTTTPINASETFSSFVNEFRGLQGKHSTRISDIPVAVIITKADLYKKEIGLPKIYSRFKSSPSEFIDDRNHSCLEITRNGASREFLEAHGYRNVINLLEGDFNDVQYFPVSAMGHMATIGQPYEPWGVEEPVLWLLSHTESVLAEKLSIIRR
jgi:GTPase SAR1 family protein